MRITNLRESGSDQLPAPHMSLLRSLGVFSIASNYKQGAPNGAFPRRLALTILPIQFGLFALLQTANATNVTWTGGGSDNNWNTGANWGGSPPISATTNNLIFSGASRLNNTNNIASLTNGWLRFANGDFTLNGNVLVLNPSGTGVLTNSAGTNTIALDLIIVPNSKIWNVAANSELRIAGGVTHTSGANPLITLNGGGTLRITSTNFSVTRAMTLNQGTVVVDGGFVDHSNDGIRFVPAAGVTVETRLKSNGTWRIGGGGNFRLGFSGAAAGSTSQMVLESGTLELYGSGSGGNIYVSEAAGAGAIFNQNGGLVWFSGSGGNTVNLGAVAYADGTYNLNGGTLWVGQVIRGNAGATNAVFNFNGGTLRPLASTTTFMQGLQAAFVKNGGAIIDTTNFNITIAQNLLSGGGGLTKLGAGTLVLSGTNSYTGNTIVSNGTLNISGRLDGIGSVMVAGGTLSGTGVIAGPVTIQAAGTLAPGASVGTLNLQSNLTLAGAVLLEVDKSLAATNDLVQVSGFVTNLGGATVVITNLGPQLSVGDSFKFFNKAVANGAALTISPTSPGAGMAWTNKMASDGSIGIVAAPIIPTPADLIDLVLSAGTLSPAFSSNVLSYTAGVAYTNTSVTVTPTTAVSNATIRVICGGVTNLVASGATSPPISLKSGANLIDVKVTAPDNSITKDYIVTLTRTPPNIVVVLADDQGFSDWGCYGGEIPTPNLDRLAAGGLRFRRFYNGARCSPTRCSILTGLYPQQAALDPAASLPNLRNDNNITMAELLGSNGYRTYMAGKWHLGTSTGLNPWQRGFLQFWGFPNGDHADEWDTNAYTLVSTDGAITNRGYAPSQFYQPDAIGDYCLDYLNSHFGYQDGKPLFLYMAFGSAHFPLQAPRSLVDSNTPVYSSGWDFIRGQRYTNMLAQGVIDANYPLSFRAGTAPWSGVPVEAIPAWNTLAADRQADLARRMAIYASMIQKMDANIGRVVERLRTQGQLDNTLIFVLSDNGGNYEGGVYGMTGSTANAAPLTGSALDNMGQSGQPSIYLGGGWANVNDTPYRLFKHFNHEGGIRTPMIVHWPQGLSRTNQWEEQPGHLIDVMATVVDVTGASYPTQLNSHAVLPLEGKSIKPLFTSAAGVPRTLGFEHEGNRALLSGNWKLVSKNFTLYNGSSPANELELYNLATDPVELTNQATVRPALLTQFVTNWNNWATRVGVPSSRLINPGMDIPVAPATNANDLFVDTFARPDNTDTDASATGMWGSRVPPLGTNVTYYEGFEGSGLPSSIQILDGTLQMAVGLGMAENGIMHNFVGQDIVDAGGFSVELTIQQINTDSSDAANRYVGFAVGLSQAEAATGADINDPPPPGAVAFRGRPGGNTGVADFFVELDLNGNVKVWRNGTLLDTVPVGQNYGTLTASFALSGFKTNDTVTVTVFFNGQPVDINTADTNTLARTFKWDRNNSNYIGLSARASNFAQMDNLAVRKLPLTADLVIGYAMRHGLSGAATAPDADPDGDGVNNFGEWAFGGDPTAPDPFIASLKGVLVTLTHDFQFEFQRLISAASLGLTYRYFVSEDLKTWTETAPVLVSADPNEDNPNYEVVALRLPAASLTGKSKLFLRVVAEPTN